MIIIDNKINVVDFKLLFTFDELLAIAGTSDEKVKAFLNLIADQRFTQIDMQSKYLSNYLDLLISLNVIDENRKSQILMGIEP